MGWKGTIRTLAAAARAAERGSQRRRKQEIKEQAFVSSAHAVDILDRHIKSLVSVHTALAEAIDWEALSSRKAPIEPIFQSSNQDKAVAELENFKPNIFHIFKGGSDKIRKSLERKLSESPSKDQEEYKQKQALYFADFSEWKEDKELADMLLQGKSVAIRKVINEMSSDLSKDELIGTSIIFSIEDNFVHAQPQIHGDDIVPSVRRKQLASGKLSETKMPIGQFNELYQDYVASVALKTAGDLFQILPLSELYVTCCADMLNPSSGHFENTPILSVKFVRGTFSSLNLNSIDPSEALRKFKHNMAFSKSKGFLRTEPLVEAVQEKLVS